MQCGLVYTENTAQSISTHQIYKKSRVQHPISLYTENILSTLLKSLTQYCSVHWSIQSTLSTLYMFPNLYIFQRTSYHIIKHWRYLERTVNKTDTILQCVQDYTEYTVQSLSVHQIYAYFRVKSPLLYTENILSTLFTILSSSELNFKRFLSNEKNEYRNESGFICDFIWNDFALVSKKEHI